MENTNPTTKTYIFVKDAEARRIESDKHNLTVDELKRLVGGEYEPVPGSIAAEIIINKDDKLAPHWKWQHPFVLGLRNDPRNFAGFERSKLLEIERLLGTKGITVIPPKRTAISANIKDGCIAIPVGLLPEHARVLAGAKQWNVHVEGWTSEREFNYDQLNLYKISELPRVTITVGDCDQGRHDETWVGFRNPSKTVAKDEWEEGEERNERPRF